MEIQKYIAILANPSSGAGRAIKAATVIQKELAQRNISFQLFSETWPEQLNDFSEVWLAGGDGTVNYFINKYRDLTIPLAIFKGGTGNDFAWKLYGDISLEEQVELVLNTTVKQVDAGSCNGRLYANSLGIGFDGEVLRSMDTIRWMGGHLGYLFVVIKKIFSFKEFTFRITAGGKEYNEDFLLVIVNNSSRTGGGFMVSPKASLTDGFLDMMLCEKLPVLKRLRYLPVIEKGKHSDLSFIQYSHETSVKIDCEKEMYGQLDGELIAAASFDIRVLNRYLSIKY